MTIAGGSNKAFSFVEPDHRVCEAVGRNNKKSQVALTLSTRDFSLRLFAQQFIG